MKCKIKIFEGKAAKNWKNIYKNTQNYGSSSVVEKDSETETNTSRSKKNDPVVCIGPQQVALN